MKKYDIDQLIEKCGWYMPTDGRLLVHPLKLKTMKQKDYSFDVADTKANEGKDPKKHRVDLKKVHPKISCAYQEAIVLQCDQSTTDLKPGDTIIYRLGAVQDFDLVDGVSIMRKYDVVATKNVVITVAVNG